MKIIKNYNQFLILEKYNYNIRKKLIELGVTGDELNNQINLSKKGNLGKYLHENGGVFTFGILKAIFKDAINAKKITGIKKRFFEILPIAIPLTLTPFFPIVAIVGAIFGTSKLVHKVFDIVFNYLEPDSKYSDFLKRMVDAYMKIPEGSIDFKDRFSRAFVVSDRLIDAIKPEVIDDFTNLLSLKMEKEDDDKKVPDHFIENELKIYLNDIFHIDPKIPLKD